uniref:Uncharacterized protein n=1 Tax=Anguilla anguilla TaxID=7936 RepID=A0A0E9TVL6_ANGAN
MGVGILPGFVVLRVPYNCGQATL